MGGTVAASKAAEQRDRPERAKRILLWVPSVPFARPVIPDVRRMRHCRMRHLSQRTDVYTLAGWGSNGIHVRQKRTYALME